MAIGEITRSDLSRERPVLGFSSFKIPWKEILPPLLVILAFVPMLTMHGIQLWRKSHYQFFPMVLCGSLILGYVYVRKLGRLQPGRWQFAAGVVGFLSLLMLGGAIVLQSSLVAMGSFLLGSLAFIYSYGGWRLTKALLPSWIFLWLIVPPPFNYDEKFIQYLQTWTTRWSSYVLDLFNIIHVMDGNVVIVPPARRLMVEEACSGISSFFAILTCSLFFVFWSSRSIIHAVLLISGGIIFVLAANVTRVAVIAIAQVKFNKDLATGWAHDALGFVIFGVLLILVASLDQLLCFLFNSTYSIMSLFKHGRLVLSKLEERKRKKVDLGSTRWPSTLVTWVSKIPVMGLATLLLLASGALAGMGLIEVAMPSYMPMANALNTIELGDMPAQIPVAVGENRSMWERVKFDVSPERSRDDKLGQFSRNWQYSLPGKEMTAIAACDYPFFNWHDLTTCYQMQSWILQERKEVRRMVNGREEMLVEASFDKGFGEKGYLIFTLMDEQGMSQPPSTSEGFLQERIRRFRDAFDRRPTAIRFQVQTFAIAHAPFTEEQKQKLRQLFDAYQVSLVNKYRQARFGGGN